MDNDTKEIVPFGKIISAAELGRVVRQYRRTLGATQAELAGLSGTGVRFISELERGKETLELGLVLRVLSRLGLDIEIHPRSGLRGRSHD